MNADTLTLSPETVAEKLPDCKPGEKKTITLEIEVTGVDDSGLTANVSNVEYAEGEATPAEPEGALEGEIPAEPPAAPAKSKRPAAVIAVLGKK